MWFKRKKDGPEPNGQIELGEVSPMIERLLQLLSGPKDESRKVLDKFRVFMNSFEGSPKDRLLNEVIASGVRIESWAKNFINQKDFIIDEEDIPTDVQYVTPQMLGFQAQVSMDQFFLAAHEQGFKDMSVSGGLYALCITTNDSIQEGQAVYCSGSLPCQQDDSKRLHILRISYYGKKVKKKSPGKALELVRIANDRFIESTDMFLFLK